MGSPDSWRQGRFHARLSFRHEEENGRTRDRACRPTGISCLRVLRAPPSPTPLRSAAAPAFQSCSRATRNRRSHLRNRSTSRGVRRRLRAAIDKSRRAAADRRARVDAASAAYATFLEDKAGPLAHMVANALRAEGYNFTVFTPAGGVRLSSAKSGDDYLEFALDSAQP